MVRHQPRCSLCRQHHPDPNTTTCVACRVDTATNLGRLPGLLDRLTHHLATRPTTLAGIIGRGAARSRPAANLTALTLLAATPTVLAQARTSTAPPGRQTLSIPVWATSWHTVWAARLDTAPTPVARAARRWSELQWNDRDTKPRPDGVAVIWPHPPLPGDQLAAAWHARYGHPNAGALLGEALHQLRVWLPHAWTQWPDTVTFARQLLRHTTTAAGLVGDPSPTAIYLGDCPEPVIDPVTGQQATKDDEHGVARPQWCGARIYYQPNQTTTSITCPSCRIRTDEKDWYWLAARMRDVWGETAEQDAWAA